MAGSFSSLARLPLGGVPFAAPRADTFDDPLVNVGRRKAPRLRLSIPARLVTISETRKCILLDVSRGGAQIGLRQPLAEGEAGFLRFAGFELFGCIVRRAAGFNGLEFDDGLSDHNVIAIRRYAEAYDAGERDELRDAARAWVSGGA
jgi:hypothetical protein